MERCFVGFGQTGKALDHKYSFKGQMSAFYLFGESLSQSATAAIYRLGPGYKVCDVIITTFQTVRVGLGNAVLFK